MTAKSLEQQISSANRHHSHLLERTILKKQDKPALSRTRIILRETPLGAPVSCVLCSLKRNGQAGNEAHGLGYDLTAILLFAVIVFVVISNTNLISLRLAQ